MAVTERVKQILSWYASDNPGVQTQPRAPAEPRHARRHRQAGHPARRPGLRARPRALVRAEPGRLRSRLPLPARHRRRLQRLRGAARLPRGGRRQVRRAGPADPEAQQLATRWPRSRAALGGDRLGQGRAAPRLLGDRLHDLPGLAARNTHVRGPPRAHPRGQESTACRRWCGPIRAAPASPRRARPAVDVTAYAAQIACQLGAHIVKVKPPKDVIEQDEAKKVFEKYKHPDQDAGRPRAPRRAELLQRQAHRHLLGRRGQGHRRPPRRGRADRARAAASARSWGATPSSARAPRRSSCWPT